jgi:hypothetical protein
MTKEAPMGTNEWYQQSLTPPDVVEVNIRIGVVPSADHAQVLAEAKDPTTNIQIAMWSSPHITMHGLGRAVDTAVAKALAWIGEEVEPF